MVSVLFKTLPCTRCPRFGMSPLNHVFVSLCAHLSHRSFHSLGIVFLFLPGILARGTIAASSGTVCLMIFLNLTFYLLSLYGLIESHILINFTLAFVLWRLAHSTSCTLQCCCLRTVTLIQLLVRQSY